MTVNPQIDESWKNVLEEEFKKEYFTSLKTFLLEEKQKAKVFPPGPQIFSAFNETPFHNVKAVILGQDPYHGTGQAHGMCFSVQKGIKPPPSLENIFKELKSDVGVERPNHGYLLNWAQQGVFLLNAILTVRAHQAASHQKKGWENFTDAVIKKISSEKEHVVFLLWGRFAQSKAELIDSSQHLILKAAHPSPFSAHNGFLGCKHFSKTNKYLRLHGIEEIDWSL